MSGNSVQWFAIILHKITMKFRDFEEIKTGLQITVGQFPLLREGHGLHLWLCVLSCK